MDYSRCITAGGKNYAAIEKIIARLSFKDYIAVNPLLPNGKPKYKTHKPYSLSEETMEALYIKKQYLSGNITENEYKTYCLRKNLI